MDGISAAVDVGRPITKASSTAVQAQGDDQGWDENGQEWIHWRDVQQLREQLMAMGRRGLRGEGDKSVRNYWQVSSLCNRNGGGFCRETGNRRGCLGEKPKVQFWTS